MKRGAQDFLPPRPQGSEAHGTAVAEGSHSEGPVEATMFAGDRTASDRSRGRISRAEAQGAVRRARSNLVAQVCRVMLAPSLAIRGQRRAKQSGKNAAPSRPRKATILRSRGYMRRRIRSQKWAT